MHDPNWRKEAVDAANRVFQLVKANYHLGDAGDSLPEVQDIIIHLVNTLQLLPNAPTAPPPPLSPDQQLNTHHRIEDEIKEISSRLRSQEETLKSIKDSLFKFSLPTLSFAQAAALPSRTTNTSRTSKPPSLRYVVNFKGNPPPHAERIPSERATRKINERLRSTAPNPNLFVLGVSCKPNGNYIISYSSSSSETDAEKLKHRLSETLAPHNPMPRSTETSLGPGSWFTTSHAKTTIK